jgi:aarF domain-containing kinase
MDMTTFSLSAVKFWFPEFEFTWLGEEMRENLPREMDFGGVEAPNALRLAKDFAKHKRTTLYIPEVLSATKRTLVMEYIDGARVSPR